MMKRAGILLFAAALLAVGGQTAFADESGPKLGAPGKGPVIDRSGDSQLQEMIREVAPAFQEEVFKDPDTGKSLPFAIFSPQNQRPGKSYPLVLFMADASTAGRDLKTTLMQGYGALIWATKEAQAVDPCYVLVPQFSGAAVNDAFERTDEVDIVMRLMEFLIREKNVDQRRLYAAGQSMGGMIAMNLNISRPQVFAASMFVDCHWNPAEYMKLVEQNFIFVVAGESGKSFASIKEIEDAAEKRGRSYTFAGWSAKLPQETQDGLAQTMLEKGAPINIFNFEPGTVLPEDGNGSEHMYSFDYAWRLEPARQWLFRFSREADWLK